MDRVGHTFGKDSQSSVVLLRCKASLTFPGFEDGYNVMESNVTRNLETSPFSRVMKFLSWEVLGSWKGEVNHF